MTTEDFEQKARELEAIYYPDRKLFWSCVNNLFRSCAGRPEFVGETEIRRSINEESDFVLILGECRRDWRSCEKCR